MKSTGLLARVLPIELLGRIGMKLRFDDGVRNDDIEQRVTRGEADLDAAIWTVTTND
jgi:hypothetical protein